MSQTKNISVTPGAIPTPQIHASQNDVGREIIIKTYDGSAEFDLTGMTVTWAGTKPSGLGFTITATVSGNVATFETTNEMTSEYGSIASEIKIADGDDFEIGSQNVTLVVEQNPHPDSTTDGTAEAVIPQLTILVERIEAAADSIHDLNVDAETLAYDQQATASYDSTTNKITFGIPRGGMFTAADSNADGNIVITFI